jgi:hypothetical protein
MRLIAAPVPLNALKQRILTRTGTSWVRDLINFSKWLDS